MAALKLFSFIFFIILCFRLGSSIRVLSEMEKATKNGVQMGLEETESSGDIPSISIGAGGGFFGFGNGAEGGGSISIPGFTIPGLVIGGGAGGGVSGGCSCNSCKNNGTNAGGGSGGCNSCGYGGQIRPSVQGSNGDFSNNKADDQPKKVAAGHN
ncbi:glycine-rich cell wall structural protein 1 [Jatropha curcas]|nr:glycine-rich cell wall structural protein 1 [Jatropha curcas]